MKKKFVAKDALQVSMGELSPALMELKKTLAKAVPMKRADPVKPDFSILKTTGR